MSVAEQYIDFVVNDSDHYRFKLSDFMNSDVDAFGKGKRPLSSLDLLKRAGYDISMEALRAPSNESDYVITRIDIPKNINRTPGYNINSVRFSRFADLKGFFNVPYGINVVNVARNSLERVDLNGPLDSFVCHNNKLTELNGLEYVKDNIHCVNNKLTELHIEEGVRSVYCYRNNIKELTLPYSIEEIACDEFVTITNYHAIIAYNPDVEIRKIGPR